MLWLYNYVFSTYPRHSRKKMWIKVRFLHETEKAFLVLCEGEKVWVAKSRVYGVRLKKSNFEVRVK